MTASWSDDGRLVIGGCDTVDLAERFGTPLLVLDRATFEARAAAFTKGLVAHQVFYAAKAFVCVGVCELVAEMGLGLDVCTGGELSTALAARFPTDRIIFHGNNKSVEELTLARDAGVGRIVVDSFHELDLLETAGVSTRLLVRVTPGVEAHTHEYVQTAGRDSKFGFVLDDGVALQAVERALSVPDCELVGLHAHIGSQILDFDAFEVATERLAEFSLECSEKLGFGPAEVNLGGGFGIAHTDDEIAPEPEDWINYLKRAVDSSFSARHLPVPALAIEPGRSIVGPAMITLYRVGTIKTIAYAPELVPGERHISDSATAKDQLNNSHTYVAVDGGMGDNIRPPLYGAKYGAFVANRPGSATKLRADVVGKFCESGDYLIKNAALPEDIARGDLLCIPATGAYTYSMASTYNRQPRPAVVMVNDGDAGEIIRRETVDDLLRLEARRFFSKPATRGVAGLENNR